MSGSFFKIRSQGGTSILDNEEVNKIYKRALITLGVSTIQAFAVMTFMYDTNIISPKRTPRMYNYGSYVVYPSVVVMGLAVMYFKHKKLMDKLDRKYTPLWLEVSS